MRRRRWGRFRRPTSMPDWRRSWSVVLLVDTDDHLQPLRERIVAIFHARSAAIGPRRAGERKWYPEMPRPTHPARSHHACAPTFKPARGRKTASHDGIERKEKLNCTALPRARSATLVVALPPFQELAKQLLGPLRPAQRERLSRHLLVLDQETVERRLEFLRI
jgi:hypothetical protein